MWTNAAIAQAFGWSMLLICSPWIFVFFRKISAYAFYALYPRDIELEVKLDNKTVERYLLKQGLFQKPILKKISSIDEPEIQS